MVFAAWLIDVSTVIHIAVVHVKDAQKFREAFEDAKKIMSSRLQSDSTGMTVHFEHYCGCN